MNREIKFRGKRRDNGEWLYGDLFHLDSEVIISDKDAHIGFDKAIVDPDSVGQYTGAKDANGQEIYEGDIIMRDGDLEQTAVVAYERSGYFGIGHYRVNGLVGHMTSLGHNIAVIGNIHDNPELMK